MSNYSSSPYHHTCSYGDSSYFWVLQPAKRHAYAQAGDNGFTPVERELVFDVVSESYSEELHPS